MTSSSPAVFARHSVSASPPAPRSRSCSPARPAATGRRSSRGSPRYARLPIRRTYSDPEAYALALLDAAGYPTPLVNVVIAGHKPDLAWPHVRHIVELDGPDFHQFPDEDLRKQAVWERAGWTVARLPTNDVYDNPQRLLAAAEPALSRG